MKGLKVGRQVVDPEAAKINELATPETPSDLCWLQTRQNKPRCSSQLKVALVVGH